MKQTFLLKRLPLVVLISGLVITVAFAQTNSGSSKISTADTLPKKQKQIRDLDDALLELDKGEVELQKAMREVDGEKIEREIRQALKTVDVDMAKMKEDIAKAMKEVDFQKINVDVQKALSDAQREMKQIDGEKMRKEIQESIAKVDMEKIKVELEKVKEIDLSGLKKELAGIRPEIEKSLQEAKKEIDRARQEITTYKNLVNALDKDGHLQKEANYKVEYKAGELTVNGKRLSADLAKKYSEFLTGKKDFTLQKDDDNFNINKN